MQFTFVDDIEVDVIPNNDEDDNETSDDEYKLCRTVVSMRRTKDEGEEEAQEEKP